MAVDRLSDLHILIVKIEGVIGKIEQEQTYCKTDTNKRIEEIHKLIEIMKDTLKTHEEKDQSNVALITKKILVLYGYGAGLLLLIILSHKDNPVIIDLIKKLFL